MKNVLLFSFLFLAIQLRAQTIWSDNFNTSTWTLNVVTATEGADPNFFTVSDNEGGVLPPGCGVGGNGNNTLHITSMLLPTAGASYDAGGLCGILNCPETHRRAETPVINCSGYSNVQVSFDYIENGQSTIDNATLWYYNGNSWSQLDDMPKTLLCSTGQGQWTARTVSLPASANNNANVKLAFAWDNNDDGVGTDPSFALDNVLVSGTQSTANQITTLPISITNYCACTSLVVSFNSTGNFIAGNVYSAQLSAPSGSFTIPTVIGSLNSTANSGSITCQIPCSAISGSAYRIRVVSNSPTVNGTDNGSNLTITSAVTPTIQISTLGGNFCQGMPLTFVATITNGGTNPSYQWKVNGVNVGTNSSTYTSSTLVNSNIVTCTLTSSALCANPMSVTSNPITITLNPPPVVIATANPNSSVCLGDAVSLFGSGASQYTWTGGVQNNIPFVPTATSTYTVTGTNAAGCTGTSVITVSVVPNSSATLSLTSAPNPVLAGQNATFTANIGGATAYQIKWYKGNTLASTTFNPTNTCTTLISSLTDSVFAVLFPQGCFNPDSIKSNTIIPVNPTERDELNPDELQIFPNPASDRLQILQASDLQSCQLFSSTGSLVRSLKHNGNATFILDVSDLAPAVYYLELHSKEKVYHRKISIQH